MNSITSSKKEIVKLCNGLPVTFLGLFGSYARNESTPSSDIDFLIDYTKDFSYFDMCDFRDKLEVLLARRVDLVPRKTLKTSIQEGIYKDLIVLYEK